MKYINDKFIWGILRLTMGWIFLWSFLDKVFGLGFSTIPEQSWLVGGSPTYGFLTFGTKGPFVDFFQSLAGNPAVDWLFMLGLLFVGVSLMLGIFVRLGAFFGTTMLLLIYLATSISPEHNPFIDEHIIYALVMIILMITNSGYYLGFGKIWARRSFIQKHKILQ